MPHMVLGGGASTVPGLIRGDQVFCYGWSGGLLLGGTTYRMTGPYLDVYTKLETMLARLFLPRLRGLIRSSEALCWDFCMKYTFQQCQTPLMWLWQLTCLHGHR